MKLKHAWLVILALGPVLSTPAGAGPLEKVSSLWPFGDKVHELPLDSVQFADRKIAKQVIVQSVRATRTEQGNVMITILFHNKGGRPIQLAVRSSFFERGSAPVEVASSWRTVHIQPKSYAKYQELSLGNEEIANFLVEVQGGAS